MRYFLILILIFFSCNKSHIPKEYRKMQRNIKRNERLERRNLLEIDTTHFKWYPLSDSVLIGTPKILR